MADPVEQTPFKYVKIEREDDELVIEAGLRGADGPNAAGRASAAATAPNAGSDAPEPACDRAIPDITPTNPEDTRPSGRRSENAAGTYRETTLDDLGHEPMPRMQRAVLIGIAVLVILFAVYALFF